MQPQEPVRSRLQAASALPETLAACFDAFEAIRVAAHSCTDRVPELFAAFLTTAGAATEGREAVTTAPSLPAGPAPAFPGLLAADASIDDAISILAGLGALLEARLAQAAATAASQADRRACQQAAAAAVRIRQLMGRGRDATGLW